MDFNLDILFAQIDDYLARMKSHLLYCQGCKLFVSRAHEVIIAAIVDNAVARNLVPVNTEYVEWCNLCRMSDGRIFHAEHKP